MSWADRLALEKEMNEAIAKLFEMGATFRRNDNGFLVNYPEHRKTDAKQLHLILQRDGRLADYLLVEVGLLPKMK